MLRSVPLVDTLMRQASLMTTTLTAFTARMATRATSSLPRLLLPPMLALQATGVLELTNRPEPSQNIRAPLATRPSLQRHPLLRGHLWRTLAKFAQLDPSVMVLITQKLLVQLVISAQQALSLAHSSHVLPAHADSPLVQQVCPTVTTAPPQLLVATAQRALEETSHAHQAQLVTTCSLIVTVICAIVDITQQLEVAAQSVTITTTAHQVL